MTALPGGAADKAGNRYEHWWTAMRIADVLEGCATRIRLEPPGARGVGVEFEVDEAGVTWGEQVKEASSGGTWTINRLDREHVLEAIGTQLSFGRQFRLVVSTDAPHLADLSARARKTEAFEEFTEVLTDPLTSDLQKVAQAWEVTRLEAWALLKRIHVEHHTVDSLRYMVAARFKLLFAGDPDLVIAELRRFGDDRIHQSLTAPQIRAHLESKGFRRRRLAGDSDTITALHGTVERHRRRAEHAEPSGGLVARADAAHVLERLQAEDCRQVMVLDGRAGFGKSTVTAAVACTLEAEGWFVAVARMDGVEAAISTSDKLGVEIGLTQSPAVLLAGVADGSPALLVIDQLDAISTHSGRMSDNFDSVEELLAEIIGIRNVRVLLVVRTVDLEADPRLRRLVASFDDVERHTVGLLGLDTLRDYLANKTSAPIPQLTLELLRIPLHLAVFDRLSDAARSLPYRTLQDLYEQYTKDIRRSVGRRVGHLDWSGITSALIGYMNQREVLTVPAAVLDAADPDEVEALESESVIVRDDGGLAFFHESYFDYLFARAFVAAGRDLHTFLATSGQFLFRRAQTRQILEHLVATDRSQFRQVVVELLVSATIRPHLKEVVVGVLVGLDPENADWAAIDDLAWSESAVGRKLLGLLSRPGWFDAADSRGCWERWLADPARVDAVFRELVIASRERPARVETLLRPYVGVSEDWRSRLRFIAEWSLTPVWTDLVVELVERGDLDDARGPVAVNSDFWSIVYGLSREDPAAAARLTGAYLMRGLVRARREGSADPFESGYIVNHSPTYSVLGEIAELAPTDFVEHVLPFVVEVAVANQSQRADRLPAGRRWGHRYRNHAYSVDEAIFVNLENALGKLAIEDPARCGLKLENLRDAESDELRFLACRTLLVSGTADQAVEWLLADERNLALGWADSPLWASRELVEAWSPLCSEDAFQRLEETVLAFSPSWETRSPQGHAQFVLLSAMDQSRLSVLARHRLGELERRFPEAAPNPPSQAIVGTVQSPIGNEPSKHMSDEDWLRALRKHSEARTDWRGLVPVGGSRELAQVLGQRAREEPERFAQLALRFDGSIPDDAADHIIRSIAGHADVDLVADVCEHALRLYGPAAGRSICWAAQEMGPANNRMVALIKVYADDPDPETEQARTAGNNGESHWGGDLLAAGLNSTRGQAALAAASILFATDQHLDDLLPVVEKLAVDPVLAVRVCAAEATVALLRHAPERALTVAGTLFATSIDVHDAPPTERLLTFAVLRDPEHFAATLTRPLSGPEAIAKRAGRVWASAALRDAVPSALTDDVRELSTPARCGAAEVFAQSPDVGAEHLKVLFNDEDAAVRASAAGAMRHLETLESGQLDALLDAFIASPAFGEHFNGLIDALESATTPLPKAAITACEQAVDIAGSKLADISTGLSAVGSDLIRVILRLYRQGDADARARCIDTVDRLTELNAYGVAEALENER